jgi:hypothetical protein
MFCLLHLNLIQELNLEWNQEAPDTLGNKGMLYKVISNELLPLMLVPVGYFALAIFPAHLGQYPVYLYRYPNVLYMYPHVLYQYFIKFVTNFNPTNKPEVPMCYAGSY